MIFIRRHPVTPELTRLHISSSHVTRKQSSSSLLIIETASQHPRTKEQLSPRWSNLYSQDKQQQNETSRCARLTGRVCSYERRRKFTKIHKFLVCAIICHFKRLCASITMQSPPHCAMQKSRTTTQCFIFCFRGARRSWNF